MRDPDRIPMILAALQRRWRQDPDARLGQLLVNVYRRQHPNDPPHPLFDLPDGKLLELLGPQTDEERRYIAQEPAAERRGCRDWQRQIAERQRADPNIGDDPDHHAQ